MSTDRDVTRIVRSWLEEGVTTLPDRVLDDVLDQVPATPQRRSWWPARRFAQMNNLARIAIAAAVVVVVAILGYNMLPARTGVGGPAPTASPGSTPTPAPIASPRALTEGALVAGEYSARPFPAPNDSLRFTFTVPDGWEGWGSPPNAVVPNVGTGGPDGAAMAFLQVTGLFSDPCHGNAVADVPVGTTVNDLVAALQDQTAYEVSAPVDVTLGGYSGKRMDLQLPSDVDFGACDDAAFWVWEPGPYAQGPGNRWHLWILDVDGARVVILAQDFVTTSAQDQAELQAIVDSIQIEP
ncbi:MAG TPA: hypothetical protein VF902_02260 [Coriobacteriia bacterium]